jgi:hypothetical protein
MVQQNDTGHSEALFRELPESRHVTVVKLEPQPAGTMR